MKDEREAQPQAHLASISPSVSFHPCPAAAPSSSHLILAEGSDDDEREAQPRAYRPPPGLGLLGGGVVSARPVRELLNLTTSVDTLTFSHDSQVCVWLTEVKYRTVHAM